MGCQGKPPWPAGLVVFSISDWLSWQKMMLHPLAERYLSRLRVEGGLSVNTIEAYRRDLNKFHSYLQRIGVVPIGPLTAGDIDGISPFHARGTIVSRFFPTLSLCYSWMAPVSDAGTDDRGESYHWFGPDITSRSTA